MATTTRCSLLILFVSSLTMKTYAQELPPQELENGDVIRLKSWKGDYLHRPDIDYGVVGSHAEFGNKWTVEKFIERYKFKSWKGDYLARANTYEGGATTRMTGTGNIWRIEVQGNRIKFRSIRGDYLYRTDSPDQVTSWVTPDVGNLWKLEIIRVCQHFEGCISNADCSNITCLNRYIEIYITTTIKVNTCVFPISIDVKLYAPTTPRFHGLNWTHTFTNIEELVVPGFIYDRGVTAGQVYIRGGINRGDGNIVKLTVVLMVKATYFGEKGPYFAIADGNLGKVRANIFECGPIACFRSQDLVVQLAISVGLITFVGYLTIPHDGSFYRRRPNQGEGHAEGYI